MTIPLKVQINTSEFVERCKNLLKYFEPPYHSRTSKGSSALSTTEQRSALNGLEIAVKEVESPLQRLEHSLHYWVAFFIIPIFALSNSGFIIDQDAISNTGSLTTGIGFLGGIGFTMSIFLSGLAFESYDLISTSKMAIFGASLLAGIVGFLILKLTKTN